LNRFEASEFQTTMVAFLAALLLALRGNVALDALRLVAQALIILYGFYFNMTDSVISAFPRRA